MNETVYQCAFQYLIQQTFLLLNSQYLRRPTSHSQKIFKVLNHQ